MAAAKLPFADRREAGRLLAEAVFALHLPEPLVLALPRGGVPVAVEVARRLRAPLELLLVRKIGAPGHAEYGLGAVVDGDDPQIVLNDEAMQLVQPAPGYVEAASQRALAELERRRKAYFGTRAPMSAKGRVVVLVDDGIATGATVMAALKGLKRAGAARVIVAAPVAAGDALLLIKPECDGVVCLATPEPFGAVGMFYADFLQVSDQTVIALLHQHLTDMADGTGATTSS